MLEGETSNLATSSLIIIITVLFLYWYSRRNHDYWKIRGIPFEKPALFVGSTLKMLKTPPPYLEYKRFLELGPVHGSFHGSTPLLTVGDTKILKKILVKDFAMFSGRRLYSDHDDVVNNFLSYLQGERWKRIRAVTTQAFSSAKLKRMTSIFKDCSKTLVENLKKFSQQEKSIEIKRLYETFTLDVVTCTAFSTKINLKNIPENQCIYEMKSVFQKRRWRYPFTLLFPNLMKFLTKAKPSDDLLIFKNLFLQIIEERKKNPQTKDDYLQLLLDAGKEIEDDESLTNTPSTNNGDIKHYTQETAEQSSTKNKTHKSLTVLEVISQCLLFLITGAVSPATVLSYVTYCLAVEQQVQEKLRQEIDAVLKQHKGELTYEAIQDMKYLDNVIFETLRLYPPTTRSEKIAQTDYKLTELSITIPKGMIIRIPYYSIHRDPQHWPEPEKFDPDRFNANERAKRDSMAYLPFGTGPRNCVAMRFALLELKVCLVYVLSAFNIEKSPRTKVPLEFVPSRFLTSAKELSVALKPRKEASIL